MYNNAISFITASNHYVTKFLCILGMNFWFQVQNIGVSDTILHGVRKHLLLADLTKFCLTFLLGISIATMSF